MDVRSRILAIIKNPDGNMLDIDELKESGINVERYYDDEMLLEACGYPEKYDIIYDMLMNKVIAKDYHFKRVLKCGKQRYIPQCVKMMMETPIPVPSDIRSVIEEQLQERHTDETHELLPYKYGGICASVKEIRSCKSRINYIIYDAMRSACKGVKIKMILGRLSEQDKHGLRQPGDATENVIISKAV